MPGVDMVTDEIDRLKSLRDSSSDQEIVAALQIEIDNVAKYRKKKFPNFEE